VRGDIYQLTQIYLNLAKNAFDAMDEKNDAHLIIKTKLLTADQVRSNESAYYCQKEEIWNEILKSNEKFAMVEFIDNGNGIPKENLEYLFDTFFTTKERGKGTGLGLSISMDIAKKLNGIQVYIPIADEED